MKVCTASKGFSIRTDGGVNCRGHDRIVFFDLVVFIRIHCKQATQKCAGGTLFILVLELVSRKNDPQSEKLATTFHTVANYLTYDLTQFLFLMHD